MINKGTQRLGDKRLRTEIVDVCRECLGDGYQRTEPFGVMIPCHLCKGSGRVLIAKEITITVAPYEPFKPVNFNQKTNNV